MFLYLSVVGSRGENAYKLFLYAFRMQQLPRLKTSRGNNKRDTNKIYDKTVSVDKIERKS
jgi:hypothetical protein